MYDCDVESAKNIPDADSIKTYNPNYRGSQIFNIFDNPTYPKYFAYLGEFLKNQNRGMYAIWNLRSGKSIDIDLIAH